MGERDRVRTSTPDAGVGAVGYKVSSLELKSVDQVRECAVAAPDGLSYCRIRVGILDWERKGGERRGY